MHSPKHNGRVISRLSESLCGCLLLPFSYVNRISQSSCIITGTFEKVQMQMGRSRKVSYRTEHVASPLTHVKLGAFGSWVSGCVDHWPVPHVADL